MIACISFAIEAIFIGVSFYTDMGSRGPNILQLVGTVLRVMMFLSVGILYIVYTARLQRYMITHHPKRDDKVRLKMQYTFIFNWILGPSLIFKSVWTIAVLGLLNNPTTYALFWWIDMLVMSLILLSLSLSPFFTLYYNPYRSSAESTGGSRTLELTSESNVTKS